MEKNNHNNSVFERFISNEKRSQRIFFGTPFYGVLIYALGLIIMRSDEVYLFLLLISLFLGWLVSFMLVKNE